MPALQIREGFCLQQRVWLPSQEHLLIFSCLVKRPFEGLPIPSLCVSGLNLISVSLLVVGLEEAADPVLCNKM